MTRDSHLDRRATAVAKLDALIKEHDGLRDRLDVAIDLLKKIEPSAATARLKEEQALRALDAGRIEEAEARIVELEKQITLERDAARRAESGRLTLLSQKELDDPKRALLIGLHAACALGDQLTDANANPELELALGQAMVRLNAEALDKEFVVGLEYIGGEGPQSILDIDWRGGKLVVAFMGVVREIDESNGSWVRDFKVAFPNRIEVNPTSFEVSAIDLQTGRVLILKGSGEISPIDFDQPTAATSIAWGPKGAHLAMGLVNGDIKILRAPTAQSADWMEVDRRIDVGKLHHPPAIPISLDWNSQTNVIAVGSSGHNVGVFDLDGRFGSILLGFGGHSGPVTSVAVSPDGSIVASGDSSGKVLIKLLDSRINSSQTSLLRLPSGISDIAWSPDGSRIAVATAVGQVRIIRWPGMHIESDFFVNGETQIAWGPASNLQLPDGSVVLAGSRLITGSADGHVHMWKWVSWGSRSELLEIATSHWQRSLNMIDLEPDVLRTLRISTPLRPLPC